MAVLANSVELPLLPEQVWEGVIDLDSCSQWMTLHDGFPEGPRGNLRPGLVFKENVRVIGMPGAVTWTVAEFDKPKRIQLDGKGPLGLHRDTEVLDQRRMPFSHASTTLVGCWQGCSFALEATRSSAPGIAHHEEAPVAARSFREHLRYQRATARPPEHR